MLGIFIWMMGCATNTDRDSYPIMYASAYCRALKKCSRGQFESLYELMEDCESDVGEAMSEFMSISAGEGCQYDNLAAQDCLQQMSEASCEEHWEDKLELQKVCYEDTWVCEG
ncbi:MAG: hypothetical protein ACON4U_20555 [Myxococcota bacterium]